ncbi:MAG: hypothetical protein U0414_12900 [Polyangiaceae bacterium]
MVSTRPLLALTAALSTAALVACSSNTPTSTSGSASVPASAKPANAAPAEHHGEHEEHGDLGAPLTAFHDVLAPLWHGAKGDTRTTSTCAAAADLHERALAVDSAGPPANAQSPDLYKERAKKLIVSVDDLGTECGKPARPDFEAKFAAVHEAFHGVMEASAPK